LAHYSVITLGKTDPTDLLEKTFGHYWSMIFFTQSLKETVADAE